MGEDPLRGNARTRPGLPIPDPGHQRRRVGPAGQLDQLRSQILLQRAPGPGGPSGQLIARLLGNVPDRDRRHACIMLLAATASNCSTRRRACTRDKDAGHRSNSSVAGDLVAISGTRGGRSAGRAPRRRPRRRCAGRRARRRRSRGAPRRRRRSAGGLKGRQSSQATRDHSSPIRPITIRITPAASTLNPSVRSMSTANVRMAPVAMKKRLTPVPTVSSLASLSMPCSFPGQ